MAAGTILVSEVIDEARDFDPSFDKIEQLEKTAMRQISRAELAIAKKVVAIDPLALAEEAVFLGPERALLRGWPLGDHLDLLEISFERNGVRYPLSLVGYTDRMTEGLRKFPSAYLIGNTVRLVDRSLFNEAKSGWEEIDSLRAVLVKSPPRHVLPSEPIGLPDVAYDALVANLAHFMALRVNHPKTATLFANAQDAENLLVANLTSRGASSTWHVRVVDLPH